MPSTVPRNDFAQVMTELIDEYDASAAKGKKTRPAPDARSELRRLRPQSDPVRQKLTQMGVNMRELGRFL